MGALTGVASALGVGEMADGGDAVGSGVGLLDGVASGVGVADGVGDPDGTDVDNGALSGATPRIVTICSL